MPDDEHDDLRDLPIVREIGVELRALAADEDHREALRVARRRRWRGRPAVLGLAAALAVVAPATAAISGLWSPDVPPEPPMSTVTVATATTSSSACEQTGSIADTAVSVTTARPPSEMLEAFGVLRTAQTAEDRAGLDAPEVRVAPGEVAAGYVRHLGRDAAGRDRWLVPSLVTASSGDAGCRGASPTSQWMLSMVGGGGAASDYRQVIARGMFGASDPGNAKDRSIVTGVVPDGAEQVTVAYAGAADEPRTWPVARNFFSYAVALPVEQAYTATLTWDHAAAR